MGIRELKKSLLGYLDRQRQSRKAFIPDDVLETDSVVDHFGIQRVCWNYGYRAALRDIKYMKKSAIFESEVTE